MKMIFPAAFGVALVAGLAGSAYAPPAMAHFDCERAYQQCVASGQPVGECQLKEDECWITNQWPDGYVPATENKRPLE